MNRVDDGTAIHVSDSWRWPFLVAIAVLLLCGGLAMLQEARFAEAAARIEHTYEVLDSIDRVVGRLVDAETAYRGYLLTRTRAFLQPYEGVDNQTRALLRRVEQLVADSPEQQARAGRLTALAEAKLIEMTRVLALSDNGDAAGAAAAVADGEGKRVMDEVRAVAAEMGGAESSLLAARSDQARLARRAALTFAVASLLVALAVAFVAVSVQRQLTRRRAAFLEEMAARVEAQRQAEEAAAELLQSESFNRSILDNSGDCIQVLGPRRPRGADESAGPGSTRGGGPGRRAGRAVGDALERRRQPGAAGNRRCDGQRRGPVPRLSPDRQGHAQMVGRHRHTHSRRCRGQVQQLVTVSRDISEQKRAEQERALLLASERAARSEAERAARMKDDFVSTLSHELRTPLNAILGWIGVLKQQQSPETLAKAIDVIDRNSRRQSQMVDDLLDMSRIMSGKLRLDVQRLDAASVIEEALASAQPAADAKGVRLVRVLGSAAIVQGDPGRLQQVVWNLVSNAIKFTPRGGLVQVTLRKVNSHIHVQVSDSGQGIRADLLPHVFQRFRQGDASATRHHGGLGLGLAIVKNLVEMHGGSVEAASEGEGVGSVFTVRLPAGDGRRRARIADRCARRARAGTAVRPAGWPAGARGR